MPRVVMDLDLMAFSSDPTKQISVSLHWPYSKDHCQNCVTCVGQQFFTFFALFAIIMAPT